MRILSIKNTNTNNQSKANVAFAAKNIKGSTVKKTAGKGGVDVAAFFSKPENLELIKRNQRYSQEVSKINRENQHAIPTLYRKPHLDQLVVNGLTKDINKVGRAYLLDNKKPLTFLKKSK